MVFVAGVEEGLLPISRAVESEHLSPEELEEERRLFYVGMTRAKRLLYLTYASCRAPTAGSATPFPHGSCSPFPTISCAVSGAAARFAQDQQGSLRDKVREGSGARHRPPMSSPRSYEPGQKVFHPKFGEGHVDRGQERER